MSEHEMNALKIIISEQYIDIEQLQAENARLREVLSRLVTERTAGLASREAWDKARAALGKE